jgi:hypothetical protein
MIRSRIYFSAFSGDLNDGYWKMVIMIDDVMIHSIIAERVFSVFPAHRMKCKTFIFCYLVIRISKLLSLERTTFIGIGKKRFPSNPRYERLRFHLPSQTSCNSNFMQVSSKSRSCKIGISMITQSILNQIEICKA